MTTTTDPRPGDGFEVVFRGRRVATTGGIVAREVGVRAGCIVAVEPYGSRLSGAYVVELSDDEVLLPGLVDTHVHINEPGRTDWEAARPAEPRSAGAGARQR